MVITDRNDLDGQLFGLFSLSQVLLREQPVQDETRQDLRAKLANRPSGGIVFTPIQKFRRKKKLFAAVSKSIGNGYKKP